MFAGGLIALIAVVGLVIDGGNVFFNRRDDQNASDLASLAGTKRLYDYYTKSTAFTTTDNVYSAVQKSLQANGCVTANGCTWTARYVGDQIGTTFPVLGTVRCDRYRPAERRRRAVHVRDPGGRPDPTANVLPGRLRSRDLGRPDHGHRDDALLQQPSRRATSCPSRWSMARTSPKGRSTR